MADDFYDYKLAIDPLTGNIVPGATAAVYTVDDTAHSTPLAITDLQGVPLPGNQITAGPTGIFPPFKVVSGAKRVIAVDVSSGVVTPMSSEIGKQGEPGEDGPQGPPWTPGAHQQNVAGATVLTVITEHMYELTATAGAAVTLDGGPGTQVAVKWLGAAGTLQGVAMAPGAVAVAACWPTGGWMVYLIGGSGDTTAPTPGTLSSSAITSSGFTLTVTGAADAGGLHATPYRFSTDNGATWSPYQASAVFVVTGKAATTLYTCKHQVQDAAGNVATGSSLGVTTASGGDVTPPTPGTVAGSAITSSGFTLTISGASDAGGLHATPYAFSTDNGVTWSAYQASASLAITGKTATTGYQCKGRVRDAAGNTADTPAQTVTTSAFGWFATSVMRDTFTRADGSIAAGAMDSGQTWAGSTVNSKIYSNLCSPVASPSTAYVNHGATGNLEGRLKFVAPASQTVGVGFAFKSAAGANGDGAGFQVSREATRDIVQFEGSGITCTFNNGNGSTSGNPWAYLPGADYATAKTYDVRCQIVGTVITVYCDGVRILEGTFAGSSNTYAYLRATQGLKSFGYVDDVQVLTP